MATVPFPTMREIVEMGIGLDSDWTEGFSYPGGYIQELKGRLPDVQHLHHALTRADQGMVDSLLRAYLTKLTVITPEQVVAAQAEGRLDELVDRARQAVEFQKFLADLEKRYFPEHIKAREERRRQVLATWE